MATQISPAVSNRSTSRSAEVSLWSALRVSAVGLLFGMPAGIGLACINWRRMGLATKANTHLIVALMGTVALVLVPALTEASLLVWLAINIAVALYLGRATEMDTAAFKLNRGQVRAAGWGSACLFAIAAWVAWLVFLFIVSFMAVASGVRQGPASP